MLFWIVVAFALGWYLASRRLAPRSTSGATPPADAAAMAGAFPEGGDSASSKQSTKKRRKAKTAMPSQQSKPAVPVAPAVSAAPVAPAVSAAPVAPVAPAASITHTPAPTAPEASVPAPAPAPASTLAPAPSPAPNQSAHGWAEVGSRGAQPQKKKAAPIPAHATAWSGIASDMDLDESERAQPSVRRVVRIGAPLRPAAPKVRPPAPRTEPAPLTKKQRQSRKKAERQREERAQAAETQEQRLRAHRRELEEIRSRQQWAAERRKEIRKPPAGAAPNRAQGAPSLVDGRLIWM